MGKKGVIHLVLVVIAALLLLSSPVLAEGKVSVYVNGKPLPSGSEPISVDGRVMVPLRVVAEMLNARVYWFPGDSRIEVKKGFRSTELWVSAKPFARDYAIVDGKYRQLDVAPMTVKGNTYVPLRLIGEGIGAAVEWDSFSKTVVIQLTEPEQLTGYGASVRDSVYNTFNVKSVKLKLEGELRLPEYPELNIFKFDSIFDRQGNMHVKGHLAGWSGEGLYLDEQFYLKSILSKNLWVGLEDLLGEAQTKEFEWEKAAAQAQFKDLAYDCTTELIRAMGNPLIRTEESVNGISCWKVTFRPDSQSQEALKELKSVLGDFDNLTLTLWIGKGDELVHKLDFQVDFKAAGYKTGWQGLGFAHVIAELSEIDQYFTVEEPHGFSQVN